MKAKNIIACIMSLALTFSSLCCPGNINKKDINTVSADSFDNKYYQCTDIDCTIKNPDFIISENDQLSTTDLQRHGIQMTRSFCIYNRPYREGVYRKKLDEFSEPASLWEFEVQFPQELAEGKNTIHICTNLRKYGARLECDLDVNIIFSEDSEKKDLRKRSETMFGDIDSSSEIDIQDLVMFSQYLLGDISSLTAGQYMCGDVTGDDQVDICDLSMLKQYLMHDDVDLGRTKNPDEDILLIKAYTNYAWGFQCNGVIYDKEGNEYNFDFSDREYNNNSDEKLLDRVRIVHRTSKCNDTHTLNAENMTYINSLINKLDENPEFNEPVNAACDFGQIDYYAVKYNEDGTAKLIKVYSCGDSVYTPKDENADELYSYYCEAVGINIVDSPFSGVDDD